MNNLQAPRFYRRPPIDPLNFLFFVLLIVVLLGWVHRCQGQCLKLDVVLVGDYSGSVEGNEPFVRAAFHAFADRLDLGEDQVRLGIVLFGDQATIDCPLTGDRATLLDRLALLETKAAQYGGTDLTSGLLTAGAMLTLDRPDARKLVVLISDGLHNNHDRDPQALAQLLQLQQVQVAPVLILSNHLVEGAGRPLMVSLASPGLYHEASYETLIGVLKKLDVCL